MNIEEFKEKIKQLNIEYTEKNIKQLEEYYKILVEENKKYNLTAITEKKDAYLKHFYDSLTIVNIINLKENLKICDIGSGAGFPGIVLKIFYTNLDITLVDSSKKRTEFLKTVINKLNLKNIEVIPSRAEELETIEKYDIVTARAVAPLNILLELSARLIKINGYFIALKGKNGELELEKSKNSINKLDLKIQHIEEITLPNNGGERTIIKLQKQKKTNKKYPRNYSQIKKNPL